MGVYFNISHWIRLARPARVILTYNTPDAERLTARVDLIRRTCGLEPEIVFCSKELASQVPFRGTVEPSLVDLDAFTPADRSGRTTFVSAASAAMLRRSIIPKTCGFMRGWRNKAAKWTCWAPQAKCRRMPRTGPDPYAASRQLRRTGVSARPRLLFYRTSPQWAEPWGRVIIEAMASGLPVVTDRTSGASSVIEHGRNGLLFDTTEEAFDLIMKLARDPALRRSLGQAGRVTAEDLLSADVRARLEAFYLDPAAPSRSQP
ncbi:glycosyltransferase [Novosphingobium panipatense]